MGLVTTEDKIFQWIFVRWNIVGECTEQKSQTMSLRIKGPKGSPFTLQSPVCHTRISEVKRSSKDRVKIKSTGPSPHSHMTLLGNWVPPATSRKREIYFPEKLTEPERNKAECGWTHGNSGKTYQLSVTNYLRPLCPHHSPNDSNR